MEVVHFCHFMMYSNVFIFLVHAFVNETWVRIWVNIRFSDFVSLELATEIKQKKKKREPYQKA